MIYNSKELLETLTSPVRQIGAVAIIYNGETEIKSFTEKDNLISLTVERVGENCKFFGFGICQKLKLKLIDINREIDISTANNIEIQFSVENFSYYFSPKFYVTEVYRDENTNQLSITGYDLLYKQATAHTVAELEIDSYTLSDFADACASIIGANGITYKGSSDRFDLEYPDGANFDGTESIREALTALAEVTQTVYYINSNNEIVFSCLKNSNTTNFIINKKDYIELKSGTNRRLSAITHTTELGDNITATNGLTGTTQYIRDNPFLNLREDIATILNNAINTVGGLTINQFSCKWRGIFDLEIADKIGIVNKDNTLVYSFILNDVITYNGAFSQETQWQYKENESESTSNSTNLGDAIKQTYAKVDKVEKQIELVSSEANSNSEKIAALQINTDSISASIANTRNDIENVNGTIEDLTNKVETIITPEEMEIAIKKEIDNGVDKVTTSTGFTFDETGLTVSKTDSEMNTTITEDGMIVYKNNEAVLTANNVGVDAVNLHATTYLIIGNNSRFEDYTTNRTGCFWIGG